MWKLNNKLPNNQWVKDEIKRVIKKKKTENKQKQKHSIPKFTGCNTNHAERNLQ